MEEERRDAEPDACERDGALPGTAVPPLPVVGLGGADGGVEACLRFLARTPADTGLAYVVVLRLEGHDTEALAGSLRQATPMPVTVVGQTQRLERDSVFVVPPGQGLRSVDGHLHAEPEPRTRQAVVDLFFRSLAESHGPHATAVVLSGTLGDGAIGLKRIKERGGLTVAQEPEEARSTGMPRAAVATGMVDWVLPVDEMPARIVEYQRMERRIVLLPDSAVGEAVQALPPGDDEALLRDVLTFLRTRTGRDFSGYKRATIRRRVGRRMQVNGIAALAGYLSFLRTHPGEAGALLQDLLISVTNFFRDADCFGALEAALPRLFAHKTPNDVVRVWIAACATGEEAYSIAMLLAEHLRTLEAPPRVQVFATDLDDEAIRIAREGAYPPAIEADVSEERLRRFFVKEHRGWRVRRELREMVLFAVHDVLKDSPFSRLELACCRNLLIYLDRPAQQRVLETFHFALQPEGLLFLGSSESVDDGSPMFSVLDKKHRLYLHRSTPRVALPVPSGPGTLALAMQAEAPLRVGGHPLVAEPVPPADRPPLPPPSRPASWGELHLKLLEHLSPPSVLIDPEHEIVHLSPSAGRFLQFTGGEPSRNLLRAIHPALRIELRAALYRAAQSGSIADAGPLPLEIAGETLRVAMSVRPVGDIAPGFALVVLRANAATAAATAAGGNAEGAAEHDAAARHDDDPLARHLDRELERLKAHLRDTVEQYEASTEELKASNEELQAMNEELRSATEELETSREELQSINEELTTVNHELKNKVEELGHSNSDMQNLMDATAIATVFLDRQLHITRYTPSAVALFSLIPSDIGRPLSDLSTPLRYPELGDDARRVLERLVPVEREVAEGDGSAYLVRLLPYRTVDDRIAGVVLTFVDITERKHGQEALRQSEARFGSIVNQATVGVMQLALDGRITFVNQRFVELLGCGEDALLGQPFDQRVHPEDRAGSAAAFARMSADGQPFQIELRCVRPDGALVWVHTSVSLIAGADGRPQSALAVGTDVTERQRAEAALRDSEERLRLIIENAVEYAIFSVDLDRHLSTWSAGAERLLGYAGHEVRGLPYDLIFTAADRAARAPEQEVQRALDEGRAADDRLHVRKDGSAFWASGALMPMRGADGAIVGFVKVLRDQSEARATQQQLEASRTELLAALRDREHAAAALQRADEAKDRFLAVLSHELRNPLAAISGAAGVLGSANADEALRARAAQIVARQAGAMKLLLDDLMDMSRLRLGRLELQRRRVPLDEVIATAREAAQPQVEAGRHRLAVEAPPQRVMLDVDPVRWSQVLSNLLVNAAKYTPPGGEIALRVVLDEGLVRFSVNDNGIGMAPETVDSMFDMFTRSEDAQNRPVGGLGIGLALARSIVELHGGHIHGRSEGPGRGSEFEVALPLPADTAAGDGGEPGHDEAPRLDGEVLVVDDNADAAWSLAEAVRHWGCRVEVALDGAQALAMAAASRPDAMLVDIGMPGMDGHAVARAVRAQPGGGAVTLVAVSGWGQARDREASRQAGFDAHLVKPVDLGALQRLLGRRLGRAQGDGSAG